MMTTAMSTRPITCIRSTDLDHLAGRASASPRRRSNLNLHTSSDDPVQRLFNALDPDTYVRPHRHARDTGWECLLCVRGAAVALTFDDHGRVTQRIELVADGGTLAIELPAYHWHTLLALRPGTILLEVKPGPYTPVAEPDFAAWSPRDDSPDRAAYLDWLKRAQVGEAAPSPACTGAASARPG